MQQVDSEIAKSINIDRPSGVIITKIHSSSPALKAGIKVGDVISKVDGKQIYDSSTLNYRINTYKINDYANFTVIRKGKSVIHKIKMIQAPKHPRADKKTIKEGIFAGVEVANLSPYLAQELGLNMNLTGVVVTKVTKGTGWSARSNFEVNDIILSVNQKNISNTKQLLSVLKKQKGSLKVEINRDGVNMNRSWYTR